MSRPLIRRTDSYIYHLTNRSNNREWFYIPTDECWEIFCYALNRTCIKYDVIPHLLVLMSNHFHLLLSTPQSNIDTAMRYFQCETTRLVQKRTNRINHIFGARYRWSLLESAYSLAYVYKYVARNPIRSGLCLKVEQYRYCSLNDLQNSLPIVEGLGSYWQYVPKKTEDRMNWLNAPIPYEQESLIKRALRRYQFKFTTDKSFQKRLRELKSLYGIENTRP